MRVGVYLGKYIKSDAAAGGAFNFQQSILNALKNYTGQHEFFVFSNDYAEECGNQLIKFIKLQRFMPEPDENIFKKLLLKIPRKLKRIGLEKKFGNALNKAVLDNKIELMWFATPAFEPVSIPYIYTVWDLQHRLQSYFPEVSVTGWTYQEREERYNCAIPRAAYVVIGNQEGKKEVVDFYSIPENRVKTIPLPVPGFVYDKDINPVDLSLYKINKPFLFYPAQFWPHKNHILILLALKILKEKYNLDFDVIFTGSDKGNLSYVKQRAQELGLSEQTYFLNFVSIDVLVTLYRNAFALIYPSFFGPDNIPPLEAFALGCPVIAARVAGAELQLNDATLLFDPRNENELALAVKNLYADQALREKLIEKGHNLVQNYTSEKYIEEMNKIIDEFGPIRRCWSSEEIYVHM